MRCHTSGGKLVGNADDIASSELSAVVTNRCICSNMPGTPLCAAREAQKEPVDIYPEKISIGGTHPMRRARPARNANGLPRIKGRPSVEEAIKNG